MRVSAIIKDNSQWFPPVMGNAQNPTVSVILPTFRRRKDGYLERAIQSVLSQTFDDLELIIVDDCSTDGSFDLIKEFQKKDGRVGCIRHTYNVGLPAISEYEGYMKSRGEYIAFIFDDNVWYSDALEKTLCVMKAQNKKAAFGIAEVVCSEEKKEIWPLGKPKDVNMSLLLVSNFIGNGAVVLHREVIETVGLYDPHLSLTRICDWDLWRRIVERYDFFPTGIPFTQEFGPILSDSLGNSYLLHHWFAEEHCQHRNTSLLLPQNFHEIDIVEDNYIHSRYYIDCTHAHLRQYAAKHWYTGDTVHLQCSEQCRRVLVGADGFSASLMSFLRCQNDCLTVFITSWGNVPYVLPLADAFVIARNIIAYMDEMELLQKCDIPIYYYTDDNYIALAEQSEDPLVKKIAALLTAEVLCNFRGIIVSTKSLQEFFLENGLHENVILLDAICSENNFVPNFAQDRIVVAFMGGRFRYHIFSSTVLPALNKLSKIHPVHLVLPEEIKGLEQYENERFHITQLKRENNYSLVLSQYAAFHPQILVFCGEGNGKSDIYKTKNSLLNAVTLGAVLVASNIEPYCRREDDEPEDDYLLVENTEGSWYEAFLSLAENKALCHRIYGSGRNYAAIRYAADRVWKSLAEECCSFDGNDYIRYIDRSRALYLYNEVTNSKGRGCFRYLRPAVTLSFYKERAHYYIATYHILALPIMAFKAVKILFMRLIGKTGS